MGKGLLIDVTQCVGCGACMEACKEANGLEKEEKQATQLDANNYCALQEKEGGRFVRKLCMHCSRPSCASVCPVGALEKSPEGPVLYDVNKCMGCRYCMIACPWGVPTYEWKKTNPRVRKCIMCADRVKSGKPTACSEACPAGATTFGDRDQLLAEAKRRMAENPGQYLNTVLGEKEVGGTSVLFISDIAFSNLGFPKVLPLEELPERTHVVLSKIPGVVLIGGAFLYGMYWLTDRKNELVPAAAKKGNGKGEKK